MNLSVAQEGVEYIGGVFGISCVAFGGTHIIAVYEASKISTDNVVDQVSRIVVTINLSQSSVIQHADHHGFFHVIVSNGQELPGVIPNADSQRLGQWLTLTVEDLYGNGITHTVGVEAVTNDSVKIMSGRFVFPRGGRIVRN